MRFWWFGQQCWVILFRYVFEQDIFVTVINVSQNVQLPAVTSWSWMALSAVPPLECQMKDRVRHLCVREQNFFAKSLNVNVSLFIQRCRSRDMSSMKWIAMYDQKSMGLAMKRRLISTIQSSSMGMWLCTLVITWHARVEECWSGEMVKW